MKVDAALSAMSLWWFCKAIKSEVFFNLAAHRNIWMTIEYYLVSDETDKEIPD